ncbi:MAG: TIGR02996 domain-containing protein [Myxococcales bacterium]|nr:TIGR02996 domain-containing protein [Myxococcales bacterium]
MSDELLDHLMRDPTDDGRLLVYADWLQQRGDPRADYARLQLELRTTDDRLGVLARLRDLYPVDEPVWVGRMELAGVCSSHDSWRCPRCGGE